MTMAKIDEQLIAKIKEAKNEMQQIQMELGAIALAEISKEILLDNYKKLKTTIDETVSEIGTEFGDGQIDLETGEFTPTEK
jgi:hypothetical protein